MVKKIRKDTIIEVNLQFNQVNESYILKKYTAPLSWFYSSGIYLEQWLGSDEYFGQEPPKNSFIKEGKVIFKPHLLIYTRGERHIFFFETKEELLVKEKEIYEKNDVDWIEFKNEIE